jgi:hypothetical protein
MKTIALILLLQAAPDLTDKTRDGLRDAILPSQQEMEWKTIPWKSTLWDGLVQAQKEDKPILLWAMNGHPLACT